MDTDIPFFSVIVPVYNVEKFLVKCIDSILNQTFKNFEVILIDDGSSDASAAICDDYVLLDKRVKVLHKENGGVSSARNEGLKISRGSWVTFVDADDRLIPNAFSLLSKVILLKENDVIVTGHLYENKDHNLIQMSSKLPSGFIDLNEVSHYQCLTCQVWNYYFKREILLDKKFSNDLSYGEDLVFICDVLTSSENLKIYFYEEPIYIYNNFNISATSNISFEKNLQHIEVAKRIYLMYIDRKKIFLKIRSLNMMVRFIDCLVEDKQLSFFKKMATITRIFGRYREITRKLDDVSQNLRLKIRFPHLYYFYMLIRS